MNVTIVGTGYVGLVSGVMMSYLGHTVTCLDTDSFKVQQLNKNILPIYEPKLADIIPPLLSSGKLQFIDKYDDSLKNSKAIFITVGTPPLPSGEADLQYIFNSIDSICKFAQEDTLIIIKSTVPPTTCNRIIKYIDEKNLKLYVASNPEFLREGSAVDDFLNPDRILIGTNNIYSENLLREIYLPLTKSGFPLISTDLVSSELSKYVSNSLLAIKVAFINEMANLCEQISGNVQDVALAVGLDQRVGKGFLNAGPGFGGSCFPKDLLALAQISKKHGADSIILNSVIDSNEKRTQDIIIKIKSMIAGGAVKDKTIAVLGLAFKAGTDDVRSSPAIKLINSLLQFGATIKTFDPVSIENAKLKLPSIVEFSSSAASACKNSDLILICTEWPQFIELDWNSIYSNMNTPIIFDLRNLLDPYRLNSIGFQYYRIGSNNEEKFTN